MILNEVWAQEGSIKQETTDWVMAYFNFAYSPLSDEDLEDLIAFSETKPGQRLNAAMFLSFDEVFIDIARDLARTSASFMRGERL